MSAPLHFPDDEADTHPCPLCQIRPRYGDRRVCRQCWIDHVDRACLAALVLADSAELLELNHSVTGMFRDLIDHLERIRALP